MLRNFFKTALRNILRHKAYSFINFTGLTCGLALALLIISYLRHELSYDRFHERADRLYRLSYSAPNGMKLATTPPPIAPLMPEFFPGVEAAGRAYARNVSISQHTAGRDVSYEETDIVFADSSLTRMFTFEFISGNPDRALKDPYTLLITGEMAKKYFGDQEALGQTLTLNGRLSFKVGGVVKNFPETSHLRFHMLVPYHHMFDLEDDQTRETMKRNLATNFVISHSLTYVLLKPAADPAGVDKQMAAFLKKYCPPSRMVGQVFDLMPLTDIHLRSQLLAEPSATNTMTTIYIFAGIGMLTLLIACINYVNLATAQSFNRIREIGVRKILGSGKSELIVQFLAESFLFCLCSFLASFLVFYLTLPLMNNFTQTNMSFREVTDLPLLASSLGLLAIVTLLAGGYPAWFVSRFDTIGALKDTRISGGQTLRKVLVVFQLGTACMLLSGSMLLMKQLNYLSERPLGFEKENVITVPLFSQNLNAIFARADSTLKLRIRTFRDRAETLSSVKGTSVSSGAPGLGTIYRGTIPEGFTQEDNLFIADLSVDFDFLESYGIGLAAGRMFDRKFGTDDREGFMVNETAVKEFKWATPEKALGKTINREGKKGRIIGVLKDFNMESLTTPVSSLIVEIDPDQWSSVSVRIDGGETRTTIDQLRVEWDRIFPEKTFEFSFLDQQLNQQYTGYESFGKIIKSFTIIAIMISCLGVYGLVLFVVRKKVKEIGIRKVLGAGVPGILKIIYLEFAWLILAGFVLAVPVSFYFIRQWLQNFSFHTTIDPYTYVISFLLIALVVSATIAWHALRAAFANPVKSLRSE